MLKCNPVTTASSSYDLDQFKKTLLLSKSSATQHKPCAIHSWIQWHKQQGTLVSRHHFNSNMCSNQCMRMDFIGSDMCPSSTLLWLPWVRHRPSSWCIKDVWCVENLSDNWPSGRNNFFKNRPFSNSLGQSWTCVLWTVPPVHTPTFPPDHGTKRLTWSGTPTVGQNNTDQKRWCDLRERLTVSSNRIGMVGSVEGSSWDLRAPVSAPG